MDYRKSGLQQDVEMCVPTWCLDVVGIKENVKIRFLGIFQNTLRSKRYF